MQIINAEIATLHVGQEQGAQAGSQHNLSQLQVISQVQLTLLVVIFSAPDFTMLGPT